MDGKTFTVLGIETSCDETAAAVVRWPADGPPEILSDMVYSQATEHVGFGGVVPEIAARSHAEKTDHLIRLALADAGMTDLSGIDAVAVTSGPGLVGGVMVGLMSAKALALAHDLPLLPVNHLVGHALSAQLAGPVPVPHLLLLVSGGHTQLLAVQGNGLFKRLGTTIDDAVGEAFDKTATLLGLSGPGGPQIEALARDGDPHAFDLPRPLLKRPGCDFSLSGMKTAVRLLIDDIGIPDPDRIADICASFQRAVADHLIHRTGNAIDMMAARPGLAQARTLVIAGGVAANQYLRDRFVRFTQEKGWTLLVPPPKYCTDNGAMIALAGLDMLRRGAVPDRANSLAIAARPRWPLDDKPDGVRHGGGRKGPKA